MKIVNGLDMEKLVATAEAVKKDWQLGKTVWKATTKWKGGVKA